MSRASIAVAVVVLALLVGFAAGVSMRRAEECVMATLPGSGVPAMACGDDLHERLGTL